MRREPLKSMCALPTTTLIHFWVLNWTCASFVRSWSCVYDRFVARLVGLWTLVIEERVKLQRCHLCFEVRTTAKTDIQPLQPSAPRSLFSQLLVFVCSSSVFLTGALQQCTLMTYEMVYCASTVPSSPSTHLRIGLISARVHTTYDARRCEMQTVRLKADKQLAQPYSMRKLTREKKTEILWQKAIKIWKR